MSAGRQEARCFASRISACSTSSPQPQAIAKLTDALTSGIRHQVLLGVTGSGRTFTVANVIAKLNRPTLVLSHNKTLAALGLHPLLPR